MAVGVLLLIFIGSGLILDLWTDVLWFQEVGLTSILWKSITTQALVGLAVGLFVALLIWVNLFLASRLGPTYRVSAADPLRPDPLDRRVRHVLSENARVDAAVDALETGDIGALGHLLDASHALRPDEVPGVSRAAAANSTHRSLCHVSSTE